MDRLPRPGAIEVHDVEPAGPRVGERGGDRDRVIGEGGLPGEVALFQPDDATAAQVDRGQDLERACQGHITVLAF